MKKLLFVALAAVGMTACVQNQELAVVKSDAIAFDQFVNNATKVEDPSYTKDNLQNFQVWGYMEDNTGTVFTGDEVRKSGSAWVYDNIQYWAPGKAYYFEAVAPANGSWTATEATAADITALAFTNNNGTEDLLYTYQEVAARDKATLTNGVAPVQLQFAHLLSKVQFSFKNGFTTDNMTVKVSNVRMTVPAEATVALDTKEWAGHQGTLELAFGAAEATLLANATAYTPAEKALLTIPASASQTYEVKFNVQVLTGAKESLNEEVTSTISGYALEVGKAYNFTAVVGPEVFDLQPIQFNVVGVDEWDQPDAESPVGHYVTTAAELAELVNDATSDVTVCFSNNLSGNITVNQKKGVDVVIDGNGKEYDGVITINGNSRYNGSETLKFRDINFKTESTEKFTFIEAPKKNAANLYSYAHNVTIEGCTFTGNWHQDGDVETGSASFIQSYNITMKNCTATNMHSALQVQSCDNNVLVDGLTTVGCKNGVSFGNTARPTLKNSTIAAAEYGVRADGDASRGDLVVKNTTITAKQPIVVRKVTTNGYKVTLGNEVVLNTEAGYHVVFTKGSDDARYVAPAENAFTYSSVKQFNVFPLVQLIYSDEAETNVVEGVAIIDTEEIAEGGTVNTVNTYGVTSANGLKWVTNQVNANSQARTGEKVYEVSGSTIKLLADIDLSEENWDPIGDNRTDVAFTGVFDGQGHTINGVHITGDHCFNGNVYGDKEGWGLFAVVDGATVKNLKVDGAIFGSYTVISGVIAGYANNTTFENIDITNSKVAGYNWYTGGVVGWAAGECTFKNVNLDETVAVGTLWDSHGQNAGGIAGGVSSSAKITIEDCNVACVMDVINDVTSNYKWCVYRVAGMLIGNTNTTETKYNEVVTATATNVTCKNVTVTYGKWMNYHYCEGFWNRGWGRYESSDYVGGVDQNEPHNHAEGESHCQCFPFDQLFGGSANGSGHYPVKGLAEFPGVTVVYPAEYTCPVCGQQHNVAE